MAVKKKTYLIKNSEGKIIRKIEKEADGGEPRQNKLWHGKENIRWELR